MIEQGYYSNRIEELEKRKIELQSRIYADKLSLKKINDEIKKCEEAMQHLGKVDSNLAPIHHNEESKITIDESKMKPWGKQQSAYTKFMFGDA